MKKDERITPFCYEMYFYKIMLEFNFLLTRVTRPTNNRENKVNLK